VSLLLDGASDTEAARALGREPRDVRRAVDRTLSALRLIVPAVPAGSFP
jgi:hypothetical protein